MKELNIKELSLNTYQTISKDWLALCAGNQDNGYNAMTIAWGSVGGLWERGSHSNQLPTFICYVRPGRYTKTFMDSNDYFTVNHFDSDYKRNLAILGSRSGRDGDKISQANLTVNSNHDYTYFNEANMVIVCKKLYAAPLQQEGFIDKDLVDFNYPKRDFHTMYVGEIVKVLVKE